MGGKQLEVLWEDKPLHGMYHCQNEEMADFKKSCQWQEKSGLKDSTLLLIMAAQEALSTRPMEAGIYQTRQDPRSRLCKEDGIRYRSICTKFGLETPRSKWDPPLNVVGE